MHKLITALALTAALAALAPAAEAGISIRFGYHDGHSQHRHAQHGRARHGNWAHGYQGNSYRHQRRHEVHAYHRGCQRAYRRVHGEVRFMGLVCYDRYGRPYLTSDRTRSSGYYRY